MPEFHHYTSVASTMDIAHELARGGAEHGTAVIADRQTGARGTRGRLWVSGRGGIWVSVVWRPRDSGQVALLGLRTAVLMTELLESAYDDLPQVRIKWPNDMMLMGRKVGGVLCEAKWNGTTCEYVVVGVGINHNNKIPPELTEIATRVMDHTKDRPRRNMPDWVARWIGELLIVMPPEASANEIGLWQEKDILAGRRIESPQPGIASGITPRGALRVLGDDGVMREATSGVGP